MTVEETIAGAVVAQLIPEIQRVVRAELTAQAASLRAHTTTEPELLTVRQYAERANLSQCTVRRHIADGSLPSTRIGASIRIPSSALRPADPSEIASMARAARSL
jgi:excisionase family DNA binding protein